jgi:Zn-dependent peptidase ImmA (M78 family)
MFNIPVRVRRLINKYGSCDPHKIAKCLRIEIIVTKFPKRAHGFWRRILKRKIIFIDQTLTEEWQEKAVVAHEIAHIILHPGYVSYCMAGRTYYSNARKEDEADEFAAELLSYSFDMDRSNIVYFLENGRFTY